MSREGIEMTDRNAPCPCGSGKKHKKCCGQAAKSAATQTETVAATQPASADAAAQSRAADDEMPFLRHTGRGLDAERTSADRNKHLRKRLQDAELRGTLVYNNGAFFKPPTR
jgi:diacylglycerol kinase family enzyme